MDFTPGAEILRGYWKAIIAIGLTAAILAFGGSYLVTPRYTSTTRVLVQPRTATILSGTGQSLSNQQVFDATLAKPLGQTHSEMLNTRDMAERIVADTKLDQRHPDTTLYGQARAFVKLAKNVVVDILIHGYYREPSAHEGAIADVIANVSGTPLQDSYVVEIKAAADDPKVAAAIANSASKNLVALSAERYQKEAAAYRDFLKGQVDRSQTEVTVAQKAYVQYQIDSGIPTSQANLSDKLRDNSVQLAATQAEYDNIQASMRKISQTDSGSQTITTGRSSTTITNTGQSSVYQNLQTQSATLAAQVSALQAKGTALANLLGPNPSSLTPEQQAKIQQLQLQANAASNLYNTMRAAYEEALMNSQQSPVEVTPVDTANVPLYPDSPLRYLYLLIGLVCGLAGGTGFGYWHDSRRRKVAELHVADDEVERRPEFRPQPAYSVAGQKAPQLRKRRVRVVKREIPESEIQDAG